MLLLLLLIIFCYYFLPHFFLGKIENILNRKKEIQRLGDMIPDPGKLKREYNVIKQAKVDNSNLS